MNKIEVENNTVINTDNDRCYTVYMHTSPSGKRYIGITCQSPPEKRWKNGLGYYANEYFSSAIEKYSWKNIEHEILHSNLTKEDAKQKEIELIEYYKSNDRNYGYNITRGGDSLGCFNSIEISQYSKAGEFIRNWESTATASRETGIKDIGESCRHNRKCAGGYIWLFANEPLTKEHVEWCNDNRNYGRMVPVYQYDLDGVLICGYNGQIEASNSTGVSLAAINNCCHRITKTAGGYIWRYQNENLTDEEIAWCNETAADKNSVSIVQLSLDGEFINRFRSAADAKRKTGIDNSWIGKCCKGKRKTVGGYRWMYEEDYNAILLSYRLNQREEGGLCV